MSVLHPASFKDFGSLMGLWQALKLWKMQLQVRSFNVTWRRDLWGHRVIVFWKCVKLLAEQLWQIWRRAAVFSLSAKNLRWGRGGGGYPPPVLGLTVKLEANKGFEKKLWTMLYGLEAIISWTSEIGFRVKIALNPHLATVCAGRALSGGGGESSAGRVLGGGGRRRARSRSRTARGGGWGDLRPAATGRVADGAGHWRPRRQHVKTGSTRTNQRRAGPRLTC